jgi:hypothetical protein
MPCHTIFTLLYWRRGMSHIWGMLNSCLRNQECSIHFLACKTSSYQVAWWRYRLIDHWCPHFNAYIILLLMVSYEMVPYILECCTGLLVSLIVLSLSHSNGTCLNLHPKSLKVAFINSNYAQQLPALMYSVSAVESATLFCFLDVHDTSDLPSNWYLPLVLFLSILHPA